MKKTIKFIWAVIRTVTDIIYWLVVNSLKWFFNALPRTKKDVSYLLNLIILNYFILNYLLVPTVSAEVQRLLGNLRPRVETIERTVAVETPREMTVKEKIVYYAEIYGVNQDTALRIAECESNFNPKAENINGSATGVYQFVRKTWATYCDGDVYDEDANIICFMRFYNKNPQWWECK